MACTTQRTATPLPKDTEISLPPPERIANNHRRTRWETATPSAKVPDSQQKYLSGTDIPLVPLSSSEEEDDESDKTETPEQRQEREDREDFGKKLSAHQKGGSTEPISNQLVWATTALITIFSLTANEQCT